MKSKKTVVEDKKISALDSDKKELIRKIAELEKSVDFEVVRLARLRRENQDLENQKTNFESQSRTFFATKEDIEKELAAKRGAIETRASAAEKKEANTHKYLSEASDKLKAAEARLKTAETIEKAYQELKTSASVTLSKAREIQKENEAAIKILILKKNQFDKMMAGLSEGQEKLQNDTAKAALEAKKLAAKKSDLEREAKANEEALKIAKGLKSEAAAKVEEAKEIARKSQLSVDHQWNEIEIQKKTIKLLELRVKKVLADNKISDDLGSLEK